MNSKLFPTLNILLNLGASIGYALNGNWKLTAYWFFATCITTTVTYL